ncbi:YchE family NAAT transporter [Pasteurellaceae bacterium TAE3-ERU1]|uniref:YchE family NAAT transporter n=1 Tax=Spirabiliibacterium mucosae TaxID=28156 RepID=UPI001AADF67E|nr:YchE family NAAT transporter [Spirabiliibacterium mucosae]MBV7387319.1 YchE family NAAT transporter [Pasteurellaceae bacterium TAE3-ERU1]
MDLPNLSVYVQFFIGLVAIVNPFGILPVFVSMTANQYEAERKKTTLMTCVAVAVILLISVFVGQLILNLFSISIDAFRIAGGMLIVSIAMTMINGKLGDQKQNKEEKTTDVTEYNNIAVVPLAMPIMAGPGSISTTIVWSSRYNSWLDLTAFSIAVLLFALLCYALFRSAPYIVSLLGKTGSNVVTRIMGVILMSLGIEVAVAGIGNLFPGLMH